jgi:hypothetical protein
MRPSAGEFSDILQKFQLFVGHFEANSRTDTWRKKFAIVAESKHE